MVQSPDCPNIVRVRLIVVGLVAIVEVLVPRVGGRKLRTRPVVGRRNARLHSHTTYQRILNDTTGFRLFVDINTNG